MASVAARCADPALSRSAYHACHARSLLSRVPRQKVGGPLSAHHMPEARASPVLLLTCAFRHTGPPVARGWTVPLDGAGGPPAAQRRSSRAAQPPVQWGNGAGG